MHPLRAYLGIDVSKCTLDAVVIRPGDQAALGKLPHRQFANTATGIADLLTWACNKAECEAAELRAIMEPTSGFYLRAACKLHAAGCQIVIPNAKRVRDFGAGIGKYHKTDRTDAAALAVFGMQDRVRLWAPCPADIAELRSILLRLDRIDKDIRRENLRAQAGETAPLPVDVLASHARLYAFQKTERALLLTSIEHYYERNPLRRYELDLLLSIPCVGPMLGSHLLCMLQSRKFASARQVAALTGIVPRHNRSGTSLMKRTRIAKRGDDLLRRALFMPGVSLLRQPDMREFYDRLKARGLRAKQAIVALMRKLIHIAFGVLKHQRPYDAQWAADRAKRLFSADSLTRDSARAEEPSAAGVPPFGPPKLMYRLHHKRLAGLDQLVKIKLGTRHMRKATEPRKVRPRKAAAAA